MANEVKKANREEVRKAIAARKEARKAEKAASYEKMRACAKAPAKFAAILDDLVMKSARQADSWDNLRANLGLVRAAKDASAKERVAAARAASKFAKVAEEQPDVLADALREAYKGLDEEAAALELAADALGIDLGATSTEKAFADEGKEELQHGEEKGEEIAEEKAEEPDFESHEEEPVEEKEAAAGSDGFVTDRDNSGAPKSPAKAEIPQSQGSSELNKKGAEQKPTTQQYSTNNAPAQDAGKFVSQIPQSQGKSEAPSQDKSKSSSKATPTGKSVASGSL